MEKAFRLQIPMDAFIATLAGIVLWLVILILPILIWLTVSYIKRRKAMEEQLRRAESHSHENESKKDRKIS